jgi:hypothetical protein
VRPHLPGPARLGGQIAPSSPLGVWVMMDVIYLVAGCAILAAFGFYAAFLKRV